MSKKEKLLASAQKNLQKGQVAKAIKDYQQILQIDSRDIRSRQKLAELLGRNGRIGEALTEFEAVAGHYAKAGFYLKAIAVYKQMQKLDPSQAEFYLQLAELNAKQGLVGNAMAEYRNLVSHYEKQEMYADAAGVLQKMRELEPENLNLSVRVAENYARGDLKEKGWEEIKPVLAALLQKEDHAKLLKLCDIFTPFYSNRVEIRIAAGQALIGRGDGEKGVQLLKNLLQDHPEHPGIFSALAQGYRALADYTNERLTYQHLLRHDGDNLDLRQNFIRASIDSGETGRALEELDTCREAFLAAGRKSAMEEFAEELKHLRDSSAMSMDGEGDTGRVEAFPADADLPEESGAVASGPDCRAGDESLELNEPQEDTRPDGDEGAEDWEDLEIPLEFLEEVAGDCVAGDVSEADTETTALAEGGTVQTAQNDAGEQDEAGVELELELELTTDDPLDGSDLELLEVDSAVQDAGPELTEEVFELDLDDALDPEDVSQPVEPSGSDGEEEILDLEPTEVFNPEGEGAAGPDLNGELEEAEFYLQQGLHDDAERIYRLLLQNYPDAPEVLGKLSELEKMRNATPPTQVFNLEEELADEDLSGLEERIDSFADSQKGIETVIDADDAESHYNLGIAYKEMGLLDEAVSEFDKAAHNPERRVGSLTLKGICLAEKGCCEEAEAVFRSGIELPNLNDGERISLLYELGLLYESWGKSLEALDCFQSAADCDLFFRDVGEKVEELRRRLGMDGDSEGETGPKGDKKRVSYV